MNSPRAIERSVDKFYTDARLHEAGLPTPETVVCETVASAMEAVRAMLGRGGPGEDPGASNAVVIKPIFGSMGHGLVRVSDPDVAFRVMKSLEQIRAVFYVQRAIDHGGRDIRVFIAGGRVIGAIARRAPAGEWRTNIARGATARPFQLPPEWERPARPRPRPWARMRGRRPTAVTRGAGLRARSQRDSRVAGAAAGHRRRRRGRDRRASDQPRAP
jgi:RimK family alpha-L-glutamate ligase